MGTGKSHPLFGRMSDEQFSRGYETLRDAALQRTQLPVRLTSPMVGYDTPENRRGNFAADMMERSARDAIKAAGLENWGNPDSMQAKLNAALNSTPSYQDWLDEASRRGVGQSTPSQFVPAANAPAGSLLKPDPAFMDDWSRMSKEISSRVESPAAAGGQPTSYLSELAPPSQPAQAAQAGKRGSGITYKAPYRIDEIERTVPASANTPERRASYIADVQSGYDKVAPTREFDPSKAAGAGGFYVTRGAPQQYVDVNGVRLYGDDAKRWLERDVTTRYQLRGGRQDPMAPYKKLSPEAQARVAGMRTKSEIARFSGLGEDARAKAERALSKNPKAYLQYLEQRDANAAENNLKRELAQQANATRRFDIENRAGTAAAKTASTERTAFAKMSVDQQRAEMENARAMDRQRHKEWYDRNSLALSAERNELTRFAAQAKASTDKARLAVKIAGAMHGMLTANRDEYLRFMTVMRGEKGLLPKMLTGVDNPGAEELRAARDSFLASLPGDEAARELAQQLGEILDEQTES